MYGDPLPQQFQDFFEVSDKACIPQQNLSCLYIIYKTKHQKPTKQRNSSLLAAFIMNLFVDYITDRKQQECGGRDCGVEDLSVDAKETAMVWICEKGRGGVLGEVGEVKVAGFSLEAGNRRTPAATFDISATYFC